MRLGDVDHDLTGLAAARRSRFQMVTCGGMRPLARLLFAVWATVMLTSAGCSDDGPRSTALTEEDALTQGKTLVNSGEYADAIIEFNRAIELNSKSVDGFKYRALTYFHM